MTAMTKSNSAVGALDVFATLAHLFVNFGGNIPEFLNHRAVFRSQSVLYPQLSQVHLGSTWPHWQRNWKRC